MPPLVAGLQVIEYILRKSGSHIVIHVHIYNYIHVATAYEKKQLHTCVHGTIMVML